MTDSFCVTTSPSHAEERPEAASRSTRKPYATRHLKSVLILLLLALAAAGCGKKGNPQPPPDEPNTFPRTYPSE